MALRTVRAPRGRGHTPSRKRRQTFSQEVFGHQVKIPTDVEREDGTVTDTINSFPSAQDYPAKPVRLIDPFGAGGGVDVIARAVAQKLSDLWGQPVIVENHPGAGATRGPALVAKSRPDGYTLLINTSAQAYSASFLNNLAYHPLKDFIPIAPVSSQPYVLVSSKRAGITTVGELVAAAKAKPGELRFGPAGLGTGTHLGVEKFNPNPA